MFVKDSYFIISLSKQSTLLFKLTFFNWQGLHRICIGCHLQEAAAHYQYEGWTRMFVALARTNTQYVIDMLEEMFGDGPLVDPEELLTSDIKAKFDAAHKAEEVAAKQKGRLIQSMKLLLSRLPLSLSLLLLGLIPICILKAQLFQERVLKPAKWSTNFIINAKWAVLIAAKIVQACVLTLANVSTSRLDVPFVMLSMTRLITFKVISSKPMGVVSNQRIKKWRKKVVTGLASTSMQIE